MKIVQCKPASTALAAAALSLLTIAPLVFTGCNNTGKAAATPANFTTGINNHYLDHPECLFTDTRFPFETSDPEKTKQMDTLVKNLLLEKSVETSIHVSRYTVAPAGTRYAPRFCYGHREVTSIGSFTPVAVANGFKETTVTYSYTMKEVPVWAESHDVQAAFPAMAHATTSQATATITLAQSPVGWQVPD
ncbi:hypothetical protein [Tunturiibacter gelidoferens]|uniref:Lipoprotein n=2 Tax=Tunturiibacter gelidiferens TaxID=3069689 RepID=A0AAU7YVZ0_9BACT|nr:hypothetical protein [Edaphobacter lichenicola]MBB5338937.1 hypothetical protein [Edaphobacter lichenicola]